MTYESPKERQIFNKIKQAINVDKYMCTAAIDSNIDAKKVASGLVQSHAYTVLGIYEIFDE